MKIFAKPKQEVRDEQVEVGKPDESKGASESEAVDGITVFKDERRRKGSVPAKGKNADAPKHG